MTYNKESILEMLSIAPIYKGELFHEGKNEDFMIHMGKDFYNSYTYANGATKFVLIPLNTDNYVIKIPYTGSYNFESGYYDDDNYYHHGREDYWEYYGSECRERPWDYCAGEVQRYKEAEKNGLAECFAKTELLGYVNDYPVYIQEKCITYDSCAYNHHYSVDEKIKTSKCCSSSSIDINMNWLTDFRFYYGEEKLLKFINFIHEAQWDDDLRGENIGYIEDRPVLIDYSGFLE